MDITSSIKKYKNSVTRKYISLSNDEIDTITKGNYWLSKKYDGQLWFYCKSNKNSKIINSNENDISDVVKNIKKGEKFTTTNIKRIRPGYSLSADNWEYIIGKKSKKN